MRQCRRGCFETNSSSTHAICIPKNGKTIENSHIDFRLHKYGWEQRIVSPENYLYTAICVCFDDADERADILDRLRNALEAHNITYTSEDPYYTSFEWGNSTYWACTNGSVDHPEDLHEWIYELIEDENKLLRFLSTGYVITGNDNAEDERLKNIDKENFDVYWKNN